MFGSWTQRTSQFSQIYALTDVDFSTSIVTSFCRRQNGGSQRHGVLKGKEWDCPSIVHAPRGTNKQGWVGLQTEVRNSVSSLPYGWQGTRYVGGQMCFPGPPGRDSNLQEGGSVSSTLIWDRHH